MITALTVIHAGLPEAERAGVGEMFGRVLSRMERDADAVHETVRGRKVWVAMSPVTGFMAGVSPGGGE